MIKYTSMKMFKADLIRELHLLDDDVIQDAVINSEDHLDLLVKDILKSSRTISVKKAFQIAVKSFGYPSEIADVYRSMDILNNYGG